MKRTNRVEPVSTGNDASDLARATVTTTTRMEFVRRVQVLPMVRICKHSVLSMEFNCCMSMRIFFFLLILIDYGKKEQLR
jgi:hypothetical protein